MIRNRSCCATLTVVILSSWAMAQKKDDTIGQAQRPAVDAHGDPLPKDAIARMGTIRFRTGGMTTLVLSPDGTWLAASGTSRWAYVWDVRSGKLIQTFQAPKYMGSVLYFSPNGKQLYTKMAHISVWDVATGKRVRLIKGNAQGIYGSALSPNGKLLALCQAKPIGRTDKGEILMRAWIEIRDVRTDKLIRKFGEQKPYGIRRLVFADQGKTLLSFSGYDDRTEMARWNVATGREISRRVFKPRIEFLQLSEDRQTIAFFSNGLKVWDLSRGREIPLPRDVPGSTSHYILSPNGNMLIYTRPGKSIQLGARVVQTEKSRYVCFDLKKQEVIRSFESHPDCGPMAMLKDGRTFLTTNIDGSIKKWDSHTGRPLPSLGGHEGAIRAVVWLGRQKQIASISSDRTVRLWDAMTGRELQRFVGRDDHYLHSAANGKLLMLGDWRSRVVLELGTGEPIKAFQVQREVKAAATRGKLLAMLTAQTAGGQQGDSAQQLHLWNAEARKKLKTWPVRFLAGRALALSRSGERVALVKAVGKGGAATPFAYSVAVCNLEHGKLEREIAVGTDAITCLKFLSNGKVVVSATWKGKVQLWDVKTGKELQRIEHKKPYNFNFFVDVSNNGKLVATCDHTGETISLWDAKTGKLLREVPGHRAGIQALAFSPDGDYLASGSQSSTILIWEVEKLLKRK